MLALVEDEVSRFNHRWVVVLEDDSRVECVLYRDDTLCVSSQVGCAVRCPFCASGANGLSRPLRFEELVGQVQAVQALGHTLQRVTVSGVGEPLHNHGAVRSFVDWCREQNIGPSLTTTGGPVERLREWLHVAHNGLTLSIHAGTEPTRARLVPNGPTLDALYAVLHEELPRMTQRRKRKTALAYLLVAGSNDSDAEVDAFIERVLPLGLRIHLYAYNPVPTSEHQPVPEARYRALYHRMVQRGLRAGMSSQSRIEPNGGCGTLLARHRARTGRSLPMV